MRHIHLTAIIFCIYLTGCGSDSSESDATDSQENTEVEVSDAASDDSSTPTDVDSNSGDEEDDEQNEEDADSGPEDQNDSDNTVSFEPVFLPTDIEIVSPFAELESLDQSTAVELIEAAAEITRLEPVMDTLDFLYDIERGILTGQTTLTPVALQIGAFNRVHECPDGGRLLANVNDDEKELLILNGSYSFEMCEINNVFLNGNYFATSEITDRRDRDEGVAASVEFIFGPLTILNNRNELITLSNFIEQTLTGFDEGVQLLTTGANAIGFQYTRPSEPIEDLSDLDVAVSVQEAITLTAATASAVTPDGSGFRTFSLAPLGLSAGAEVFNEEGISDRISFNWGAALASFNFEFAAESPSGFITSGPQLDMNFFDGLPTNVSLSMQVSNGDPESFDTFIVDGNNSIVSSTVDWAEGMELGLVRRLNSVQSLFGLTETLVTNGDE